MALARLALSGPLTATPAVALRGCGDSEPATDVSVGSAAAPTGVEPRRPAR